MNIAHNNRRTVCELNQDYCEVKGLLRQCTQVDVSAVRRQREMLSIRDGNGTPLQYSCLENPMDGGAW